MAKRVDHRSNAMLTDHRGLLLRTVMEEREENREKQISFRKSIYYQHAVRSDGWTDSLRLTLFAGLASASPEERLSHNVIMKLSIVLLVEFFSFPLDVYEVAGSST